MPQADDLFEAGADAILPIFLLGTGSIGFRIPVYQREFNWGEEQIHRLTRDIVGGVCELGENPNSGLDFRFLGAIILVDDTPRKEPNMPGHSREVVDGQQRLTTLALLSALLVERIRIRREACDLEVNAFRKWLNDEQERVYSQFIRILAITDSVRQGPGAKIPRIVRYDQDERSNRDEDFRYDSLIASYLHQAILHEHNHLNDNVPFDWQPKRSGRELRNFRDRIEILRRVLADVESASTWTDGPTWPDTEAMLTTPLRRLFENPPVEEKMPEIRPLLQQEGDENALALTRLLAFSRYLQTRVVMAHVKVEEEAYAFDIFEALNTTGEPLTAIETFKPLVSRELTAPGAWDRSPMRKYFESLDAWVNEPSKPEDKRSRSQDLVVDHAYYTAGEKRSRYLREQRDWLRSQYSRLRNDNEKQRFVRGLVELVDYRKQFWDLDEIPNGLRDPGLPDREEVAAVLALLRSNKNTLSIPLICRYWHAAQEHGDWTQFSDAVKAIGGFMVLRRATTGGTAGIDSDYRALLKSGGPGDLGNPLSLQASNWTGDVPEINELRTNLRGYLGRSPVNIGSREAWIRAVANRDIYQPAKVVAKFLLLAASHNTVEQKEGDGGLPYLLEHARPRTRPILGHSEWTSEIFETVEHVAPQSPVNQGDWDSRLFEEPHHVHRLGNLTLIPRPENSEIGNERWERKRIFFRAFAADRNTDVDALIEEASVNGTSLGQRAENLLRNGMRNPLSVSVAAVHDWNRDVVDRRSRNLAELAWRRIAPWVGFDRD